MSKRQYWLQAQLHENVHLNSAKFGSVELTGLLDSLTIWLLKSSDEKIQLNALAVMNAIHAQSDSAGREKLMHVRV